MRNREIFFVSLGAAVVLIIAQFLTFILGISSFEESYKSSLVSKYKITAKELRRNIENPLNFGKPITKFHGMEEIFAESMSSEKNIKTIFVAAEDGTVLYSSERSYKNRVLTKELIPQYFGKQDGIEPYSLIPFNESYLIVFPIFYQNRDIVANGYIEFEKKIISSKIEEMIIDNIKILSIIVAVSILMVVFFLFLSNIIDKEGKIKEKTKNFIIILTILFLSQSVYTFFNINYFQKSYLNILSENSSYFSELLKSRFNSLLELGIPIERLKNSDLFLKESLQEFPECKEILVADSSGNILYRATERQKSSIYDSGYKIKKLKEKKDSYNMIVEIEDKNSKKGYIKLVLKLNDKLINSKTRELLLDALTVNITSLIFGMQLIIAIFFFEAKYENYKRNRRNRRKKEDNLIETDKYKNSESINVIRLTSFIHFFGELMPLSFIPLYIKQLYGENGADSFLGVTKEGIMTFPISSYMLGIAIFVLITGSVSKKLSIKKIFIICSILLISGSLLSAFAKDIYALILARFVSGLGYGGCLINGTNLVVKTTSEENRAEGFGFWSSGYAAASICAIAIGGVVANRFGYRVAFITAMVFALLFLIFIMLSMKDEKVESRELEKNERINFFEIVTIFKDRNVITNLFFIIIPFQIAYIGVFQYLIPVYMKEEGVSQSNIGRILTIFGIIYIFIPFISKIADKIKNDKLFIIAGNGVIAAALLAFHFNHTTAMVMIIIAGLSIGGMMGDAVNESFLSSTDKAKEIGAVKLMGYSSLFERAATVIVPVIMGGFISEMGYEKSVVFTGVIIMGSVVVFAITAKNTRKKSGDKID